MKREGNRYLEIGFRIKLLVIFRGVGYFKGKLRKSLFYEFGSCIEIVNAVLVEKIVSINDYLSIRE